jgi:hypothetical protein
MDFSSLKMQAGVQPEGSTSALPVDLDQWYHDTKKYTYNRLHYCCASLTNLGAN